MYKPFFQNILASLLAVWLVGCSGGGPDTKNQANPQGGASAANYLGPIAATADVAAFKINLWDNIMPQSRCGACHTAGGQAPSFARKDDINLAYSEAAKVVDLQNPANSRLVTKVGGGHNCWLISSSECAALLTQWITAWVTGTTNSANTARVITLTDPTTTKAPGSSKTLPETPTLFSTTVHPLLEKYCARCHSDKAANPQAPFFASSDVNAAYTAAKTKLDLDNPPNSRFVIRLRSEFHNCWNDCVANSTEMESAIREMAGLVPITQVDTQLLTSSALTIPNGIVASGGTRFEANIIALWEFKTGQGNTAYDTSGIEPALNLTLSGNDVSWVSGWGIDIKNGRAQGSTSASKKLYNLIQATGEYSIEAWIVPANVTQNGPARIISYSGSTAARNFTLGQSVYDYNFFNRSSLTSGNGEPGLNTKAADQVVQASEQHIVATFDGINGRRLYVNGELVADNDAAPGGALTDWNDTYTFILGNEVSGNRQWQGKLRMVAIHNRALTTEQITQNFNAGVGEKYFLLFGISSLVDLPQAYLMFEVTLFDNYSYLFKNPTFISLDPTIVPNNIPLRGLRIGLNGKEIAVGQAYVGLDATLNSTNYTVDGQLLSNIGTVVAREKGPASDEFFLTFERIGTFSHAVTDNTVLPPPTVGEETAVPDIGLRTFDEIDATFSEITGVPRTQNNVEKTFSALKQQLPTVENLTGFLSAHQVAVSQLAIEYCNALVDDSSLRSAFFGSFGFDQDVATAFGSGDSAAKAQIVNALYSKMLGSNLMSGPSEANLKQLLTQPNNPTALFNKLTTSCPSGCDARRTKTILKAMCSATLGSAAILIQ